MVILYGCGKGIKLQNLRKGVKKLDKIKIGRNLKKYREELRYSQAEIAEKLGVTQVAVSQYEAGQKVPSDEVKIKYSELFNRTVTELFYGV